MEKRIDVLLGSPKKKGNSSSLAEQVSKGAVSKGALVGAYYLNGMNIRPWQGCMKCQEYGSPECALKDYMQALYQQLE